MENKELTFGEKAVGLTFNPSNDPKVQQIKESYAKIIDILNSNTMEGSTIFRIDIYTNAIQQAIIAQMCAVKAITWKELLSK